MTQNHDQNTLSMASTLLCDFLSGKGVGNDTAELRAATSQMQPQDIAADMIRYVYICLMFY